MNNETGDSPVASSRFRVSKKNLAFIFLAVVAAAALIEFFVLGLARRTFVFYAISNGSATIEERMLRVSKENPMYPSSREVDITRYVEEALLGPISPDSLPLFPRETRLRSLLYRDGVVYVDFSEDAALPPLEGTPPGGEVFINMKTLYNGVKRNFPFVREGRFFIAGRAVYTGKFR